MAAPTDEAPDQQQIRRQVGPIIEAAVEQELVARGFSKTAQAPDLLLAYHGQLEDKVQSTAFPYSCGVGICGTGVETVRFVEGTLVLDVIDAKTNRVAWRGTSVAPVAEPSKRDEMIRERVRRMLESFPPR
jgi:hypothetical protein